MPPIQAQPIVIDPWTRRVFLLAIFACIGFFVLTAAGMVIYSGGTYDDHTAAHYQFFYNPFSDLGRLHTFDHRSNLPCMVFFILAMSAGGIGLIAFFTGFARVSFHSIVTGIPGAAGAILGTIAAICFIGVACTPWDLYFDAHMHFVFAAFRSLLLATVFDLLATILDRRKPYRLIWPFAAFILLLIGYLILLAESDSPGFASSDIVQTTGQKIIAYASIAMVIFQSFQIRRMTAGKIAAA
jgi:hypothetical protein